MTGPAQPLWTRYDYEDGTSVWQRECDNCDKGLLYAPARDCPLCHGSGFVTTSVDPEES